MIVLARIDISRKQSEIGGLEPIHTMTNDPKRLWLRLRETPIPTY